MISSELISQCFLSAVGIYLLYKIVKYITSEPATFCSNKRRLGFYEYILDVFSAEKSGALNICLAITIKSKECLVRQHVRDALILLAKRQPMLRAVITTASNGDKYFEIKDISEVITMLDISSSDIKASDWQDVWYEYTAKLRGNGLLWRVVILQQELVSDNQEYVNTFMFNLSHSCLDGVSSIKLCQQFLDNMNDLANGTCTVDREIHSLDLLPQAHEIVTRGRIWHSLFHVLLTYCGLRPILKFCMMKMLAREMANKPNNPYHEQFPPNPEPRDSRVPCRLNVKVFSKKETSDIVQTCRANNCTVTGAITTAAHLAFCKLLESEKSKQAKIYCPFAINGQRFCDPKPNDSYLGNFVYEHHDSYMKYNDSDADFWQLARETTEKIKSSVRKAEFITEITMIGGLMKPVEILQLFAGEKAFPKSSCNFISSFGSFNFNGGNEGNYKLHECFVNSHANDLNCTFSHFNYTINGKMTWQIVSNLTVHSEHAETFANHCYDKLIEVSHC